MWVSLVEFQEVEYASARENNANFNTLLPPISAPRAASPTALEGLLTFESYFCGAAADEERQEKPALASQVAYIIMPTSIR